MTLIPHDTIATKQDHHHNSISTSPRQQRNTHQHQHNTRTTIHNTATRHKHHTTTTQYNIRTPQHNNNHNTTAAQPPQGPTSHVYQHHNTARPQHRTTTPPHMLIWCCGDVMSCCVLWLQRLVMLWCCYGIACDVVVCGVVAVVTVWSVVSGVVWYLGWWRVLVVSVVSRCGAVVLVCCVSVLVPSRQHNTAAPRFKLPNPYQISTKYGRELFLVHERVLITSQKGLSYHWCTARDRSNKDSTKTRTAPHSFQARASN